MPVNRNALIRYKTIDACLRNRRRKWTLTQLIDAVSDALYEYEGIDREVSRRTIQGDIQVMRSDKLGYNAPIVVVDKKYYTYEDPDYSITKIPLSEQDLSSINEAVEILKQFKGFNHFASLGEVVQKLEDHVYSASHHTASVIDFEKNEQLKGLAYLEPLYHAIIHHKAIQLQYKSFTAKQINQFIFHPWWLKEFKNRWFCIGVKKRGGVLFTLALDRIEGLETVDTEPYIINDRYSVEAYYQHVIGVTVSQHVRNQRVELFFSNQHAPYVETKPLHSSQVVKERRTDGIVIELRLQLNFELEKEILGFGEGVVVLAPERLRKSILNRFQLAINNYGYPH
jgi:predicted DNA-binding transcriptional regulator YafY